ncbi:MAG: DEAD/DEAH box helicase [Rikenellaceae bacterium]
MFKLRPYQQEASDKALKYLVDKKDFKASVMVLPTGSGKSVIIADIASRYTEPILILQPSKEILEQNFAKLCALGVLDCSIFSASVGQKKINRITFATIGSIINKLDMFAHFKCIMIDEAHCINAKGGMYLDMINFFGKGKIKILGLTATPFRLYSNSAGSTIKMITNTRPKIFSTILYGVQIKKMVEAGFLAKVEYFPMTQIDRSRLKLNSTGADYTEKSLLEEYNRSDFALGLQGIVIRLLNAAKIRRGILVFTRFIAESESLMHAINSSFGEICAMVTGDTPKKERENTLGRFKNGDLKILCNANCLTTGFDYPELDCVVMARPTMSLAMYYQIVGRGIRPAPNKDSAWYVDLCGNIERFGDVAEFRFIYDHKRRVQLSNGRRILTDVIL